MDTLRKPFQGVWNIIRFNWHFYIIASLLMIVIYILSFYFTFPFSYLNFLFLIPILISLIVSYYIYDYSNFYSFDWLEGDEKAIKILNIHAGFDETSSIIQKKYKNAELLVFDFYNPLNHTELSIKRARKAYPVYPNTKTTTTTQLELSDLFADKILLILAAHEIRNEEERISFFNELNRVLKPNGQIVVTEHLRDLNNFLAYNIGFFHFLPEANWKNTFEKASLKIIQRKQINPFITTFILEKKWS